MRISSSAERARFVTLHGLLLALALICSYLEAQIPLPIPIPGVKLGVANIVVAFCAYILSLRSALIISLLRVSIVAFLFGSVSSFFFSLCGAMFSFLALALLLLVFPRRVSPIGLSALCAVMHNIGQLTAASILFNTNAVIVYLPHMIAAAAATGTFTGILLCTLLRKFPQNIL
ncbi:MAG: Gx transporter family protein [Clostridia bacterium]|nr:Gx transporter family protein [Clostridia bacterium]